MRANKVDIIIIKGAPGTGKSQTGKSLAKYFPKGVRLEIDNLRSMVISVDWTNQAEHIEILNLSRGLILNFLQSGFSPVIVIDTFSGDKTSNFIEELNKLKDDLHIKIFGLYTTEVELTKRIQSRKESEFKDLNICIKLNNDTLRNKHKKEFQIDTTGLISNDTVEIIYKKIMM